MPTATGTTPLVLPAVTVERLEVPDCHIGGHPDPTATVTASTALSAAATSAASPAPATGWQAATWYDTTTVHTHLISGATAGTYGLWVKLAAGDETAVRFSRRVVLI
jgi:hypothetical protein